MTRPQQDRAAVQFPPPLVFVLAVVTGFLLNRSALPLPLGLPDWIREAVGDGAVLFGAGLMITATVLFRRTGQHPSPWKSTPEMILKGPFRVTRNPMYLGMALIQLGTGLRLSNGWILGMLPLALFGVYWVAVRHEEAYLERKFGDPYLEYKSSVRRWL